MVARRRDGSVSHRRFADLVQVLDAGDLLVVNVSATIPAAVSARRPGGECVAVHFATPAPQLPDGWWVVELRTPDGGRPLRATVGERISLDGGAESSWSHRTRRVRGCCSRASRAQSR